MIIALSPFDPMTAPSPPLAAFRDGSPNMSVKETEGPFVFPLAGNSNRDDSYFFTILFPKFIHQLVILQTPVFICWINVALSLEIDKQYSRLSRAPP